MKIRSRIPASAFFLCFALPLLGQSVSGNWKTIDDLTGEARAVVAIYEKEGRLYGYIREILDPEKKDARCTECNGERQGQPISGMRIINGLEKTGTYSWKGDADSLFDPEQGRSFRSRIWMDPGAPDILKVRGYWMLFYRTQTWRRLPDPM